MLRLLFRLFAHSFQIPVLPSAHCCFSIQFAYWQAPFCSLLRFQSAFRVLSPSALSAVHFPRKPLLPVPVYFLSSLFLLHLLRQLFYSRCSFRLPRLFSVLNFPAAFAALLTALLMFYVCFRSLLFSASVYLFLRLILPFSLLKHRIVFRTVLRLRSLKHKLLQVSRSSVRTRPFWNWQAVHLRPAIPLSYSLSRLLPLLLPRSAF